MRGGVHRDVDFVPVAKGRGPLVEHGFFFVEVEAEWSDNYVPSGCSPGKRSPLAKVYMALDLELLRGDRLF